MLVNRLTAWVKGRLLASGTSNETSALVSRGLTLAGDLQISAGTLQIDGCVLGDVIANTTVVTIGPSGSVVGSVCADAIYLAGQVRGQMVAVHQIACAASANFDGHMLATQLSIEAGARITGTMALREDTPLTVPLQDFA